MRTHMFEIITIGNDILREKALAVVNFDDDLSDLTAGMFMAMNAGRGIGLAAPQVGRRERVFVVSIEGDKPRVFVNPELLMASQEEVSYEEGCLSVPGIYAKLKRPGIVKIQAWNERGRPFTLGADGLLAQVVLHELDHLNGILFVDRLAPAARQRALAQYEKRRSHQCFIN